MAEDEAAAGHLSSLMVWILDRLCRIGTTIEAAMLQTTRQFDAAFDIMGELRAAGYEAYLAGGCVRDLLLGREP